MHLDLPPIRFADLFPGQSVNEQAFEMIHAASLMQGWLRRRTAMTDASVEWMNVLDMETNPVGDIGFFRISRGS